MRRRKGSERAAIAAALANVVIAACKFVAAGISGSSALVSEGIHSLVDCGDGLLLALGLRRSVRAPDHDHPFGHGKELYFWTVVVAMMVFAVGGGMSVYEGIEHLLNPAPRGDLAWSFVVLGVSAVLESVSLGVAGRELARAMGGRGVWETIRTAKDPSLFAVVFEDTAAILGLLVAFAGILVGRWLDSPVPDAAASIVIGGLLMAVAVLLARETRGLVVGERADPASESGVRRIVLDAPDVDGVHAIRSVHFGPDHVVVGVEVRFRADARAEEVAEAIRAIEAAIRRQYPRFQDIFIEPVPVS